MLNNSIETVLKALEQKDKEIKKLKEKIFLEQLDMEVVYTDYLEKLNEYKKEIEELKDKENKRQIKQNNEKFYCMLADDFKRCVDKIINGRSVSYPCGWINKRDVERMIENINWRNY